MTTIELIKKVNEKSRKMDVIIYRQCVIYILVKQIGLTPYRVGKILDYDTDTVRNSYNKFCDYLDIKDTLAIIAMREIQRHTIDSDLVNIYIDGLNIKEAYE